MNTANQLHLVNRGRPLPSLLRNSPAFVLLAIALADAGRFVDSDLWNHLRTGQIISSTHHLIRYDPYSYTAFGHLWRHHEWLSEVVLAVFYNSMGVLGLKMLKFVCAAAVVSFLTLGLAETGAPPRLQRGILVLIAISLVPQIQFRPQLATFVLLSLVLALLARDTYRSPPRLWPLIPIFALWANLHGGYLIGLAAMATYTAVVAVDELRRKRGWRRAGRLAAITIACALATLANPDGIGIWRTVALSVTNPTIKTGISEWQPMIATIGFQWHLYAPGILIFLFPLALFVALAVSVLMSPSWDDAGLVAIAALFTAGSFISVRNMALAVIALSIPLARHVGVALRRRSPRVAIGVAPAETTPNDEPRIADADWRFNPTIGTVLAVAMAVATGLFSNRLKVDLGFPLSAVAFMKEHDLHGNLLCNYNWGSYVIWHTAPESKVFIDGRCELVYPAKVITDYFEFYFGLPRAESVLSGYPHDFVLLPPDSPGYGIVSKNPNWKVIYRDPGAVLFARTTSPAARLPDIPVTGQQIHGFFP